MLLTLVILLAAVAIAVPLSRRCGLGSILGYLIAGVAIGPSGIGLITNVQQIGDVTELGVVMLLFLIGLELRPHRLWILRRAIFGLGIGQLVPTAAAIGLAAHLMGVDWDEAALLGAGLALSSTAIVLPMLGERDLLPSAAGRDAFAVLLFQDVAAIPMVALVPLLTGASLESQVSLYAFGRGVVVIALILVGGSLIVPRYLKLVGNLRLPEVFTAASLLLVCGAAAMAEYAGLSASLGAFLAGVLVSDSEYQHELRADIEPFEGVLLGFFFISVGMEADLALLLAHPLRIAGLVLGLIAVKAAIAYAVSYARRRQPRSALRFAFALPEGSEFSFVLFGAAVAAGALPKALADTGTVVVALSMMVTPLLFAGSERFLMPRLARRSDRPFDVIDDGATPLIICGFGRMGQIAGRVLTAQKIKFTALDRDQAQVDVIRRFGAKVFYGDPSRPEVMRAAGAEAARVILVALDDPDATVKTVQMVRRNFPALHVIARARNRRHAHALMAAGADAIVRETFHSALKLTELTLAQLGLTPEQAAHAVELFRQHDERILEDTYVISEDEGKLIQTAQQAAQELRDLFESDEVLPG